MLPVIEQGDIGVLTEFSLLWRWTQDTHAQFDPDDLASIRPIRREKAEAICQAVLHSSMHENCPDLRLFVDDETDHCLVINWLEERIPKDEIDVLLVWDRSTVAVVPRRLLVNRWDDFWYPVADDLSVVGLVAGWRLEMYHYGTFDFFQ